MAQGIYCGTFGTTASSSSGAGSGSCSSSSSASTLFGLVDAKGNTELFGKSGSSLILFVSGQPLTGASFTVPVTAYGLNNTTVNGSPGGTDSGTLTGTATVGSGLSSTTALAGTLTDVYGIKISFSATSNPSDWNTTPSLTAIAGSYTGSFSLGSVSYSPSLSISKTGAISGTDSGGNGCTYSGSVAVADPSHNDYSVSLTLSCINGAFTGVGAFFPAGLNNPGGILAPALFKAGVINGSSAIYLNLTQ